MDSFWYASFKVFLSDGMQKEGEVYKSTIGDLFPAISTKKYIEARYNADPYLNKGARVEKV